MKGLTDIPGVRVGHVSDYEAITGCTVILVEAGAIAGVNIGGSATGTQDLDVLNPNHVTPHIHAICLAGGSAFGLEAACGVRNYLEQKGIGFPTSATKVPIVPGAILYDLGIGKANVRPTREMGEAAAKAATSNAVPEGNVGAGTGATVGKIRGMGQAMKGGIGSFTVQLGPKVLVSALAAVNAIGDVIEPNTGRIVAGVRTTKDSREFLNAAETIRRGAAVPVNRGENTTLAIIATNARLSKPQASKLAALAQHGMIRTICPVHTISDGDIVFTLSLGSETADFTALGVAAADALAAAILRGVRSARTLGGIPGLLEKETGYFRERPIDRSIIANE
ncbi:MAG TPA: P1 family peptidase [Bryobacteraceae bacterium]|nr:P1 family peptidase [Bryobacteraceae bacterium]